MPLIYSVQFLPANFHIRETTSLQFKTPDGKPLRFFEIVNAETREIVVLAYNENMAKLCCLGLELAQAYARGDGSKTRDIVSELQKLRDS